MKVAKVSNPRAVDDSADVLRAGGVILFPTDTQYGLGADALSDEAVEKIYAIKGRDERKPIHCIVADVAMMEKYAEVSDMARMLVKEFLPGALTLILKKREGMETGIARDIGTIGIRIPDNQFCLKLAKEFGRPITATSANKSGRKTERTVNAIFEQIRSNPHSNIPPTGADTNLIGSQNVRMKKIGIGLAIDAGELPESQPSTVVDLSGREPVILREGVIQAADIWNAVRASE